MFRNIILAREEKERSRHRGLGQEEGQVARMAKLEEEQVAMMARLEDKMMARMARLEQKLDAISQHLLAKY